MTNIFAQKAGQKKMGNANLGRMGAGMMKMAKR